MGTMLQAHRFTEADFRGERFRDHPRDLRGNSDLLCLTQPAAVAAIHAAYLDAGADILSTNSFTATRIAQADYGFDPETVRDLNVAAARLARDAADAAEAAEPGRPRFVAGSLGPTNRTASMSSDVGDPAARSVTWEELEVAYRESAAGLLEGGADILLIETIFDTLNAKAAIAAVQSLFDETGERVPLIISGTIVDASGRTLSGQTVEAFWHSIRHADPLIVGLNCALGPKQLREHLDVLSRVADRPISAYPNAGLPNELGGYDETPEEMAEALGEWAQTRPAQRRRQLLRLDARARRRDRRGGRRPAAAPDPRADRDDPPVRPRAARHPAARQRLRQRRRADQRHRARASSPGWSPTAPRTRRSTSPASRSPTAPR